MLGLGVPLEGLVMLVLLGFLIATTVNTFAMEAAVLFTPAFLFVFPKLVPGFPANLPVNAAIGLALYVELFGYSSSVLAYWFREQIDFHVAAKVLAITIPVAMLTRVGSYLVPSDLLMFLFGGLLVALSIVLYESHEHGPSLMDTVLEKPEAVLVDGFPRGHALSAHGTPLERPARKVQSILPDEKVLSVLPARLVDRVPDGYEPRTRVLTDGGIVEASTHEFELDWIDRIVMGIGGALAGLVGIAVGELTQTMLAVRKKVSIKISTGTSALVLHLTVVSALLINLALLRFAPGMAGDGFTIPFGIGSFVALGCLFGGQMGAYLNNRLSESTVIKMLMVAYFLVGLFVSARILLLGGAGH